MSSHIPVPKWKTTRFANPDQSHVFADPVLWQDRRITLDTILKRVKSLHEDIYNSKQNIEYEIGSHEILHNLQELSKQSFRIINTIRKHMDEKPPDTKRAHNLFWFDVKKLISILSASTEDWQLLCQWLCFTHPCIPETITVWIASGSDVDMILINLVNLNRMFEDGLSLNEVTHEIKFM